MTAIKIGEELDLPPGKKSFENLKVAVVVSDRLFQYLALDVEVFLLTNLNYKNIFDYAKIDFVLIECSIHHAIKEWNYAFIENSKSYEELKNLLIYAKNKSIPIVFWKTDFNFYSSGIKELIKLTDICYSVSLHDQMLLGEKFKHLQHATQPKLYPFFVNLIEKVKSPSKHILIDYAFSIHNNKKFYSFFQNLKDFKLKLIDSNNFNLCNNSSHCTIGNHLIEHCSPLERKAYLRRSSAAISFEMSPGYTNYNIWNDLEILAMGVPIIYYGQLNDDDIRKNIIYESSDTLDICKELNRMNDDLYQSRLSQLCFRRINQEHTISHRLNTISDDLNLGKRWKEFPLTTVCFATHRKGLLNNCLESFKRQCYPNKELIIAYNGVENIDDEINKAGIDSIKLIRTPREAALGCALNCAIHCAEGEYFLKMDDDDFYAENYINDMILSVRFHDIDIFGKPQNNFFRFENDDFLYKRNNKRGDKYFVRMNDNLVRESQIIIGNSISGKTEFLKKTLFRENLYRHTDTCYEKSITIEEYKNYMAVCDCFNMIVERQKDISFHTWPIDEKVLKDKCDSFFIFEDVII